MLKDGRVPADVRPSTTLLASDKQRLLGIIDYLSQQGRFDALRPFFQGQAKDPFEGRRPDVTQRYDVALADKIRERLTLGRYLAAPSRLSRSYHVSQPAAVPFSADDRYQVVGPFNIYSSARPQSVATHGGILTVDFEKNSLSVRNAAGQAATFDLAKLATDSGPIAIDTARAPKSVPLPVARASGDLPVELVLTGINGIFADSDTVEIAQALVCPLSLRERAG